MHENLLEVRQLAVRYGRREILREASFSVRRGAVYALLGRNGAGKSSLVRCVLGQQRASGGGALLFGRDPWAHRAELMRRVGAVPEESDAPPSMTVPQVGSFFARLYQDWDDAAFTLRIERFGIPPNIAIGSLSKGHKRQVSLACALSHRPEVLVLDDPTLGLDAIARKDLFSELIDDLAERNTTVFLTTHDLAAAERVATHVGILAEGRLVLDDEVDALKDRFRKVGLRDRAELAAVHPLRVRQVAGGVEAIVTGAGFDQVGDATAMSLEEIFMAVAGEDT